MKSSVTSDFRKRLRRLPDSVREQAVQAYVLWRGDPFHASLSFKVVSRRQPIYSVRVGLGYRALGWKDGDHLYRYWIGTHAEYDGLLRRL